MCLTLLLLCSDVRRASTMAPQPANNMAAARSSTANPSGTMSLTWAKPGPSQPTQIVIDEESERDIDSSDEDRDRAISPVLLQASGSSCNGPPVMSRQSFAAASVTAVLAESELEAKIDAPAVQRPTAADERTVVYRWWCGCRDVTHPTVVGNGGDDSSGKSTDVDVQRTCSGIFAHDSRFKLIWDLLINILVLQTVIFIPLEIAFRPFDTVTSVLVESVITAVFLANMLVTFRTGISVTEEESLTGRGGCGCILTLIDCRHGSC